MIFFLFKKQKRMREGLKIDKFILDFFLQLTFSTQVIMTQLNI